MKFNTNKLSLAIFAICSAAIAHMPAYANPNEKTSVFLITSKESNLYKTGNQWQLSLTPIKNIKYIAIQPNRSIGSIKPNKFIQMWNSNNKNSFKNNPPNSAYTYLAKTKPLQKHYLIKLANPKWSSKENKLTFDVDPLQHKLVKTSAGSSTLYIDGFDWGGDSMPIK